MITGPQLRAARSLIDWNREQLATAAKVSPETIKNIENNAFRPQADTVDKIVKAFAQRDVVFTENQGCKFVDKTVRVFTGSNGYGEFLDFICNEMANGGDTYQLNYPDSVIKRFGGEHGKRYLERMAAVSNLNARCIVPQGDMNFPAKYCKYRWLPKADAHALPYYMFKDFVSLLSAVSDEDVVFIVVDSPVLASVLREQFEKYWNSALEIPKGTSKAI